MWSLLYKSYKLIYNYMYPTPKRKSISKKTRMLVWQKINGSKLTGVCYCCGDVLQYKNMHVAHAVPFSLKGRENLNNLYPTCMHCNLTCGTQNLHAFKKRIKQK